MKRRLLLPLWAALALVGCDSPLATVARPKIPDGPLFAITGYSAIDPGAGPTGARPNANAAAASFDAAASKLGPVKIESFETAPSGNFTTLSLPEMTVTLSGTGSDADAGITSVTGDAILGYNTTSGGAKHLRFVPPFGEGTVTVTFTPNVKLQAWGAYLTGVGTVPNTSVEIVFDDGTAQTFAVPGDGAGGATFFGFTDPGKSITSVTVRETLTSASTRDILSIDDVRFTAAGSNTERVEPGQAATVTVKQQCTTADTDGDGQCAVAGADIKQGTIFTDSDGNPVAVDVHVKLLKQGEEHCPHARLVGQDPQDGCVKVEITIAEGDHVGDEPTEPYTTPVEIGLCRISGKTAEVNLWRWDDRFGSAEPTKKAFAGFLECGEFQSASAAPRNWLESLAMGVGERLTSWFAPKPLYAADGGFGGYSDRTSFFSWATAIAATDAGLKINVFNSGKDAFGVAGVFPVAGFDPAQHAVTVSYGGFAYPLPMNSSSANPWRFVTRTARWTYVSSASAGINYVDIDPLSGAFRVGGNTPTLGDVLPTYRGFVLQRGQSISGTVLICGSDGRCISEH